MGGLFARQVDGRRISSSIEATPSPTFVQAIPGVIGALPHAAAVARVHSLVSLAAPVLFSPLLPPFHSAQLPAFPGASLRTPYTSSHITTPSRLTHSSPKPLNPRAPELTPAGEWRPTLRATALEFAFWPCLPERQACDSTPAAERESPDHAGQRRGFH
jgi:hypothetical protein